MHILKLKQKTVRKNIARGKHDGISHVQNPARRSFVATETTTADRPVNAPVTWS